MSQQPRILAVDDDPDILAWVRAIYGGPQTATVDSLAKARDLIARVDFDVILLDIHLGDGDGTELLRAIRTEPALARAQATPVIMLTASRSAEHFEAVWEMGSTAYVTKPFSIDALRAAVELAVTHHH